MRRLLPLIATALMPATAVAQTVASPFTPATLTTPLYTQNFDTLVSMGSSNVMPAGFQLVETGTGTLVDGKYQVGTGSSNSGNAYNFGLNGTTDRALGALTSNSVSAVTFGAVFTNGLGTTINSVALAFVGEQWRAADVANSLVFQYSTDATTLQNGTWTNVGTLNFASLVLNSAGVALNGNLAANRQQIGGTIAGLSIANGGTFGFRWTEQDVAGSNPGLAIDDLTLLLAGPAVISPAPEPATWGMMVLGFGAIGVGLRRRNRPAVRMTIRA